MTNVSMLNRPRDGTKTPNHSSGPSQPNRYSSQSDDFLHGSPVCHTRRTEPQHSPRRDTAHRGSTDLDGYRTSAGRRKTGDAQHQAGQDESQGPQELIQHEELPIMDPASDKLACKSAATNIAMSRAGDAIARLEDFAGTGCLRVVPRSRSAPFGASRRAASPWCLPCKPQIGT